MNKDETVEVLLHKILNSALDGRVVSASGFGRFMLLSKNTGTHWVGSWVGTKSGVDAVDKSRVSCTCREMKPDHSAVHPLV
jgi:nucleoid DNA-binding protein